MKKQKSKKSASVDSLVPAIKQFVREIEAQPETTKGRYTEYGRLLSNFSGGDTSKARMMALALVKAGANKQGVKWGLKYFVTGE